MHKFVTHDGHKISIDLEPGNEELIRLLKDTIPRLSYDEILDGELERRVSLDCKIAFAMYPTAISELFAVADAHLLMPPKSTWFEPKLRSGLFIHKIER